MAAKSQLTREELSRVAADMRPAKPIAQYVVLSEHVYDTLKFAYKANGGQMPWWIIRRIQIPGERRAKDKEREK